MTKSTLVIAGMATLALMGICFLAACSSMRTPKGTASEHDPSQMLEVGEKAPEFTAVDSDGVTHSLSDYTGKKNLVLVFYPGDNTPGCTRQLCSIRDDWAGFESADVAVLGVNPQDADSHTKFIQKYNFPFPLLVDLDGTIIREYGARGTAGFTQRTVYGIDKSGTIVFAQRGMQNNNELLASIGQ